MMGSKRFDFLALGLLGLILLGQFGKNVDAIPKYRVQKRQESQLSSSEELSSVGVSEELLQQSNVLSEENVPNSQSQEEINDTSEIKNKGSGEIEDFHGQYSSLWPDGTVKYKVDAKLTYKQMQSLHKAIEEYHSKTCIRFDSNVPSNSLDHLSIQTTPVNGNLNVGATATTCHTKRDNYVLFREDYFTRNAMVHEFGHSLCLLHEHQRPDRNEYIDLRGKCGENDSWSSKHYALHTTNTLYDFASIWHYSCVSTACIKPKSEYSAVKKCGGDMEKGLSIIDADLINDLYDCQGCLRHRWRPMDNLSLEDKENLPALGYIGKNGRPIYPCRAMVGKGQEIAVGWWDKNTKHCKLTFGSIEIKTTKAEVLIIPKSKVKELKHTYQVTSAASNGKLRGSITAGYSISPYEVMYIAFMKDANNVGYIGKAIEKNGRLDNATFFVNGKVVGTKQFSVLTCSSSVATTIDVENASDDSDINPGSSSFEKQGSVEDINLSTSLENTDGEHENTDVNMISFEAQDVTTENHEDAIASLNLLIDDDVHGSGNAEGFIHSDENSVEEDETKDESFQRSPLHTCSTTTLQDMIKARGEKHSDKISGSVERSETSEELISLKPAKWPGGIIKYKLDSSLNQNDIDQLNVAIREYAKKTCIRIVPAQANELYTLISVNDQVCGEASICQWSEDNYLHVGQNCRENSTFIHELGHALCLEHEHKRKDREHFVTISPDCKSSSYKISEMSTFSTFYDYASVMHYGCGGNCIETKPALVTECGPQQKPGLSVLDADIVNELYDCQKCFRHRWKPIYKLTPDEVKNLPDFGYRNQDGKPLHPCRTRSSTWQEIAIGWLDEKNKACVVISEGKEYSNTGIGEVLTIPGGLHNKSGGYKLTLVTKGKSCQIDDMVPGGNTLSPYHVIYMGFMKDKQGIGRIGKVISKYGRLDNATFFVNGKIVETEQYSVLTCTQSGKSQQTQVYSNVQSDSDESDNGENSDKSTSQEIEFEKQDELNLDEHQVDSSENSASTNHRSVESTNVEANDWKSSMELEDINSLESEEKMETYEQEED